MRIVYVCPFTSHCGGVKIIAEHVARLAARGHSVEWFSGEPHPDWFGKPLPFRRFPNTDQLGAALQAETDAAIVATWWQTASWVAPNLRGRSRGFYFCQDIDELTYGHSDAGTSYKLGLHCVTEAVWVADDIQRRYGVGSTNVGIAMDHDVFAPLPGVIRDRNRVMATYRPGAGPNDLKGWGTALATMQIVCRANPAAYLLTFGKYGKPDAPGVPHVHLDGPTDERLRRLYNQAGVYLMTSRHEGFCLPALEAMACGAPVVCTDANGNREFCRDGATCLMRQTPETLAAAILRVQDDREVPPTNPLAGTLTEAQKLTRNGLLIASCYRWPAVLDRLEALYAGA